MATSFRTAFADAEGATRALAQAFAEAEEATRTLAQALGRAKTMSNDNPTENGACNWDKRVIADYKVFGPQLGKLIDMLAISTPKGAGKEHVLHMQYENGYATYDGLRRVETFA